MSLESYRNEALGFEETPQVYRELIMPEPIRLSSIDKIRKLLTLIELEMQESDPNENQIYACGIQIKIILEDEIFTKKDLLNDHYNRTRK